MRDLDGCLRDAKCWSLAETGFLFNFQLRLREVEAAMPGRYFPKTVTFAKRKLDPQSHFLIVFCLDASNRKKACPDKRDVLEERVLFVGLLDSLPVKKDKKLYDPKTWILSPSGLESIRKAEKRFPDIGKRLKLLAAKAMR